MTLGDGNTKYFAKDLEMPVTNEDILKQAELFHSVTKQRLNVVENNVERLDEDIRGNGSPGLKTDVTLLKKSVAIQEKLSWLVLAVFIADVISKILELL